MPRYAAERALPAPVEEVWAVLVAPERFAEWWPGVARVEPSVRNALAPGAYWTLEGAAQARMFSRPGLAGGLLVLEVVPLRRIAFQLTGERADVTLELEPGEDGTTALLVVDAPRFGGVRRILPSQALSRLAALVRPPA